MENPAVPSLQVLALNLPDNLVQKRKPKRRWLTMGMILLIVLILFLVGGLPNWGYHSYGFAPSGLAGVVLLIIVVLLLTGRL
jgi:Protein of unknown function (DUF3309)